VKFKMWIGNLDGDRQGLVVAASSRKAAAIVGTTRWDLENYWVLQPGLITEAKAKELGFEPGVLYTRFPGHPEWTEGRVSLEGDR
jgi:hypothetical protein